MKYITVIVLLAVSLHAGRTTAQVETLGESWRWSRFTTDSGLPHDHVEIVCETDEGTVWVATRGGLAWYDDYRWVQVGSEEGLPAGRIEFLRTFSNDDVILAVAQQLYRGNRSGFEQIPLIEDGIFMPVQKAVDFGKDGLLILSGNRLYLYQNGELNRYGAASGLPSRHIQILWPSRTGVWLATLNELYQYANGEWKQAFELLEVPRIEFRQPVELPDGSILFYISSPFDYAGFWILREGNAPHHFNEEGGWDNVLAYNVGPQGDLLCLHQSGRGRAFSNGRWIDVDINPIETQLITTFRFTARGDFIGGSTKGFFYHRRSESFWTRWRFDSTGPRDRINEILPTQDGSVWLGTHDGIGVRQPDGRTRWIQEINGVKLGSITALGQDADGNIWVGSGSGLGGAFRWDGTSWRHFDHEDGLSTSRIHKIRNDRNGHLWFLGLGESFPVPGSETTLEAGAFVYINEKFVQWGVEEGLLSGRVYAFGEDSKGSFWFGTGMGLSRWKEGEWTHWTPAEGLLIEKIFALAIDSHDQVWFTDQQSGVGFISGNEIEYLTSADGLISNTVWDLHFDTSDRLWISTNEGVSCFIDGRWSSITTSSGLSSPSVWPIRRSGNRLYLGTLATGVDILDLSLIDASPPRVDMVDPIMEGNRALLRWSAYSYWGWLAPASIETRYRIDGGPWSEWSLDREFRSSDLSVGTHEFQVVAKGFLGKSDQSGSTTVFEIPLPFYYSPPFLLPIGLLLFISVYLWIDMRKRRKAYLAELYESEERYRTLFDHSPFGIAIHDEDTFLFTNPAGAKLLGFRDPVEVKGKPLADHMSIDDWDMVQAYLSQGAGENDRIPLREISLFRKDQSEIDTEWEVIPYVYMGLPAFLSVFIDVTDRKHLEAQLLQSQKMQAVGTLAGGIAHDFNNLLTAISGYSEVMLENMKKKDKNRFIIEEILMAADRATALTNQLLVFSRQEVIDTRILDLTSIIRDMAGMLKQLIGENINLEIDFDPGLDSISADQGQIEQLIMNLILNSRDAMPGGGNITIKACNVVLEEKEDRMDYKLDPGQYVMVSVSDTGSGIPEDIRDRIFEPFFTTKEPGQGTGLGLATVHGIVQRFGSDIRVEKTADGGTCFKVFFPGAGLDIIPSIREDAEMEIREGSETILLVEDEDVVRNYLERVLTDGGYQVMTAADGAEALRISSEFPEDIHILVTDVMMPIMDGKVLAGSLLKNQPDLRVLFLSGYADEIIGRVDLLKSGQGFLKKPVKPKQLLLKIQELLTDG